MGTQSKSSNEMWLSVCSVNARHEHHAAITAVSVLNLHGGKVGSIVLLWK